MHNWIPGEEITSAKLNELNPAADSRLNKAEHNILELLLENYYSGKNTPFSGLLFDGFSDLSKANIGTGSGTNATGTAGQSQLTLNSNAELAYFAAGDLIHIFDNTNNELNIITGKASNVVEANLASFTFSTVKPAFWSDQGLVNGNTQRRLRSSWADNTQGPSNATLSKATSGLTIGQAHTLTLSVAWSGAASFGNDFTIEIKIGGVQVATHTTPGQGGSHNFNTTFTPTTSNPTIQITVYDNFNANNNPSWIWTFDFSNFQLTLGNTLFLQNALASNISAGTVKKVSATIDASNKRLGMTGTQKRSIYQSIRTVFNQSMATARAWLMRLPTVKYNLNAAANAGSTSVQINGDVTGKFNSGDTIDISTGSNSARERRTLSQAASFGGGVTTLTFTGALANSYTTAGYVERVDVKPKLSIVAAGGTLAFADLTFVGSNLVTLYEDTPFKQENDTTGQNIQGGTSGSGETDQQKGQIVNLQHNGFKLKSITLKNIKKVLNPADSLVVDVYSGTSLGAGSLIGTSDPVAGAGLLTSEQDVVFAFPNELTLANGWNFIVRRTGNRDATNYYTIKSSGTAVDFFPYGSAYTKSNNSWDQINANTDLAFSFSIYGPVIYTEDEYSYQPGTPNVDVAALIELTRKDTSLAPYAKRLGVSLNT